MHQHVHGSRYLDYVLAARYEQMSRCYGMGMEEFTRAGYAWVIRTAHLDYRRPLKLGERVLVRTWVEEMAADSVRVDFEVLKKVNGKLACAGHFWYTLVDAKTKRAAKVPDWIAEKYAI
jgi:acyl-CoA thioester hydrolase/thioesterase-3